MERNLYNMKRRPPRPQRGWRNNTRPGEVTLIMAAMQSNKGESTINTAKENAASKIRLKNSRNSLSGALDRLSSCTSRNFSRYRREEAGGKNFNCTLALI